MTAPVTAEDIERIRAALREAVPGRADALYLAAELRRLEIIFNAQREARQ